MTSTLSSIPYFSYFHDLKNFIHNYANDFPNKGINFVLVLLQLSSKLDQSRENGNGGSLLDKFHSSASSLSFGTPLFHLTPMIENLLEGMLLRCISNPPIFRSNVFMHVMREVKSLDLTQGSTVMLQDFLNDDSIQEVDWQMAQGYLLKRTINMANVSADQSVPSSISRRLPLPASSPNDISQGEIVGLQKRIVLDLNTPEVTSQESDMVTEGFLLFNSNTNRVSSTTDDTAPIRAEQQEPDYSTATEESSSTENAPTKRKRKSNNEKDQTKKRMSKSSTSKRSGTELVNKIVTKFAPTKSKAKRVRDLWKLGRSIWSNEDGFLYGKENEKREKNAFVTTLNYATKKNILPIQFVYDDGNHRMYYNDEDEE